jgi:hypothetical protein
VPGTVITPVPITKLPKSRDHRTVGMADASLVVALLAAAGAALDGVVVVDKGGSLRMAAHHPRFGKTLEVCAAFCRADS